MPTTAKPKPRPTEPADTIDHERNADYFLANARRCRDAGNVEAYRRLIRMAKRERIAADIAALGY